MLRAKRREVVGRPRQRGRTVVAARLARLRRASEANWQVFFCLLRSCPLIPAQPTGADDVGSLQALVERLCERDSCSLVLDGAGSDRMDSADDELLSRFVEAFEVLDDLVVPDWASPESQLATDLVDDWGNQRWRPRFSAIPSDWQGLYAAIPHRLPPLFERLLRTWRWAAVDLEVLELFANPPGEDLAGFVSEITRDQTLARSLMPAGFVQFGRHGGGGYDPVCFDTKRRRNEHRLPGGSNRSRGDSVQRSASGAQRSRPWISRAR